MIKLLLVGLMALAGEASAAPVSWRLVDFRFNDGGAAYGSFTYDSSTDRLYDIDIYTTGGSMLGGRHYVTTAGAWGDQPERGVLAFSDRGGPNFRGAGWFRIDAAIDFDAAPGTVVNQWLAVGAESFCLNSACSSAANEITSPGESRDTLSGYLTATAPVPEPSSLALSLAGLGLLASCVGFRRRKH